MYCVKYRPRCNKRLPVALVMLEKQAKDISSARHKLPSARLVAINFLWLCSQSYRTTGARAFRTAFEAVHAHSPLHLKRRRKLSESITEMLLRARRYDAVKLNALVLSGKARPTLVPLLYFCSDLTSAHAPRFQGYRQPLGGGGHLLSLLWYLRKNSLQNIYRT